MKNHSTFLLMECLLCYYSLCLSAEDHLLHMLFYWKIIFLPIFMKGAKNSGEQDAIYQNKRLHILLVTNIVRLNVSVRTDGFIWICGSLWHDCSFSLLSKHPENVKPVTLNEVNEDEILSQWWCTLIAYWTAVKWAV